MKTFDFAGKFRYLVLIPAILLIIGIVGYFVVGGFNWGVEFTGGILISADLGTETFDTDDVNNILSENGLLDAPVVKGGTSVDIRLGNVDSSQEDDVRALLIEKMTEKYPDFEISGWDAVGATVGSELRTNAISSAALACVLMLVYIWIRFELFSGLAAVAALVHDVVIMFVAVLLLRIQLNSSFIAAILTIVGYSINSTIIVFDRVRENRRFSGSRSTDFKEVMNKSIGQTINRCINTSITTLLSLVFLYVLGVDSVKEFTLPIIVGLIAGAFSSTFLAGPFWVVLHNMRAKSRAAKTSTRAEAKPVTAAATANGGGAAAPKAPAKPQAVRYSKRPANKKKGKQNNE